MAMMSLLDCLLLLELGNRLSKNKNPWYSTMYSIGSEFKNSVEMKGIVKVIVVDVVSGVGVNGVANGGLVGGDTGMKHTK